jgi:hypothetical protein
MSDKRLTHPYATLGPWVASKCPDTTDVVAALYRQIYVPVLSTSVDVDCIGTARWGHVQVVLRHYCLHCYIVNKGAVREATFSEYSNTNGQMPPWLFTDEQQDRLRGRDITAEFLQECAQFCNTALNPRMVLGEQDLVSADLLQKAIDWYQRQPG